MFRSGTAFFIASLLIFCVFFANVAIGAAQKPVFLNDKAEMLTMFLAACLFVIGTLQREARARRQKN